MQTVLNGLLNGATLFAEKGNIFVRDAAGVNLFELGSTDNRNSVPLLEMVQACLASAASSKDQRPAETGSDAIPQAVTLIQELKQLVDTFVQRVECSSTDSELAVYLKYDVRDCPAVLRKVEPTLKALGQLVQGG